MEKTETKNKAIALTSLYQILKLKKPPLPQVFVYVSEDPFEFEIALDHYKDVLEKTRTVQDIQVFVGETGDFGKLFAELFTPDMFYPDKLLVIKNGQAFFKPVLEANANKDWKETGAAFQKEIINLDSRVHLLVHYDARDLPASFSKLFKERFTYYKPKVLYQSEIPKAFDEICENESVKFSEDAKDEFVHKIPASLGAYLKNVRKLKLFLNKTTFSREDVENVLFNQSSLNIQLLVDHLLNGKKYEFFKEFSKFGYENSEILAFLSRFLNRLDDIRKFRTIRARNQGEVPIPLMDEFLKTGAFSDGRKHFLRKQYIKESQQFQDLSLLKVYEILLDLNIKFKTGLRDEEGRIYFQKRMLDVFQICQDASN